MSQVYVIADLHLGHAKLAQVRGFADVDAHDNAIVEAWNRVVRKRDTVYVLGDVFRTERVPELAGVKKLAPGNHDNRAITIYAGLFSQVRAYFDVHNCLLCHIPVHPSQFKRWSLNVHGHTHTRAMDDRRYVATSVEQCPRMEPMLLRNLIDARKEECLAAGLIEPMPERDGVES